MDGHKWKRMIGYGLVVTVWLSVDRVPALARQHTREALQPGRGPVLPLAYHPSGAWQQEPSTAVGSESSSRAASIRTVDLPVPHAGASPNFASLLLRLVLGTGLVACGCLAVLWLARRGGLPIGPRGAQHEHVRLVETLCLPNRCCLHLVKVNDLWVMVGCDASGLKHVGALPEGFAGQLAWEESRAGGGEQRATTGMLDDRRTIG